MKVGTLPSQRRCALKFPPPRPISLHWLLRMCGGLLVLPSIFCRAAEPSIADLLRNPEKSKRRMVAWEFSRREFIRKLSAISSIEEKHQICNQQVVGSNPTAGSRLISAITTRACPQLKVNYARKLEESQVHETLWPT